MRGERDTSAGGEGKRRKEKVEVFHL